MTPGKRRRILIANNDPTFLDRLAERLLKRDINVDFAEDGREAFWLIEEEEYDLIVLDIALPIHNGLEVLAYAKQIDPDIPVLIITYSSTQDWAEQAIQEGAFAYLLRPLADINEFDQALNEGLGLNETADAEKQPTSNFYSSVMGAKKSIDRAPAKTKELTPEAPLADSPKTYPLPTSPSPMRALARKGERLQKNRQEQLVQVLDALPDGVIELDQQGQILSINPTAREWISLESITSKSPITDYMTNIRTSPQLGNINIRVLGRNARLIAKPIKGKDGKQRTVIVIRETGSDDKAVNPSPVKKNQQVAVSANGEPQFTNVSRTTLPESYEEGWSILVIIDQLSEMIKTGLARFLEKNPFQFIQEFLNSGEEEEEMDPEIITSMSQRLSDINRR